MSTREELQFLALLVHRGHLSRAQAEPLVDSLKVGEALDDLLGSEIGWDEATVARMRRTRGGEIPEIPGIEVLGKLGTGGTADVFKVRDQRKNRMLALKVLNPAATRDAATRKAFIQEARLLESFDHPNLVRGFGVAKSGTTYFSRMEVVEGATLLELIDGGQTFDEDAALRIVLDVAAALRYLAEQGVIHRDIKAGNIMFTPSRQVKLIDLGFAAERDSAASPEDSAVGTVAYLSPEAARGGAGADMRSDIYSLGVTLFQLVVGRLPFESSDDQELLRQHIMESLSSPELKSRGFSPHLHYFIERMMAKDLSHRFQSWEELEREISDQLEGRESLDFRSDSKTSRPRRRGGRRG
ncbi:MAG: serine/threonine-protein kinase [Planctomycetota bacterium]|jgi:serine/threonine-protein kinase|nr:serine/threonine-protein kinase [Planctomycetota bacterium]MDP6761593.1 serine/threonine-protein kinase [Planctomycetota bacterium]MDP6988972.1 serine/threonine-protein kinase [Planctomycetota bacterium]